MLRPVSVVSFLASALSFFLIASDDDEVITATGEPVRVDRANAG